jgi:SAM-dependent methyltransferase
MKRFAKSVLRPAWAPLRSRIEAIADERVDSEVRKLTDKVNALEQILATQIERMGYMRRSTFVPDPGLFPSAESAAFMAVSNCQATDFYHPRYAQLCKLIAQRPHFHRKQWEWVFVIHQLIEAGVLREGARGLGFGVGTEPLPAAFAAMGVDVTATDAPMNVEGAEAWHATNQHSGDVSQLLRPEIAPDDLVRRKVEHRPCDMNAIDPALTDFDFNWSSCCFEHLGSLEHGLQFVINAVERTLKPGGVAVHTTEFNASSNEATVAEGDTVIYRLRDMEELVVRLRARGHEVAPFVVGPTAHVLDFHVDVPPYAHDIHLKLLLAGYVTTSAGLIVRRGH